MTMRRLFARSLCLGLALAAGLASAPAQPGPANLDSSAGPNLQDNLPGGLRSPLTKPTNPAPLERFIQPWEPHRALVVALTPSFLTNHPESLQTYLNLFRIAARYLDILVIVPFDRPEVQVQVVQLISKNPADEMLRNRIRFVAATNATIWARDYLPQYALGAKGRLVMLDSGRIDFTADPTEALNLFSDPDVNPSATYYRQLQRNLGDDVTPAYLASFIRTNYRYSLQLVRPPIALDGGDFITLGGDDVILSQSTLRFNGGEDEFVEQVLASYFGLKSIHYLETLPGYTIDHLDFILMPANESTILVAEPPPRMESPQVYDAILQEDVAHVLADNRRYLEEHFPNKKLIPVPMPPIPRTPRKEVLNQIRQQVLQELCGIYLIKWSDIAGRSPGDPVQKETQKQFERALVAQFGQVNFENDKDLDRVAHVVLGSSLADLEARHVKHAVAYRTYLNALFLHNRDGQRAVIIPRYKPQTPDEGIILAKMEQRVEAAFKEAFPGADLHWLDCDPIIDSFGAVHCITHTVPDWRGPAEKK
ncbi:MAG: Porphyromonas-type peptidyl-arginine deiminase [Verrucomicrobiota bacterium]|jgi:agmatine/peptidylarginine deiminase